jgi:GAF domain-containing protein
MNEGARLAALHRLQLLGTPSEPAFDRITQLAQTYFRVPIALVSLVDEEEQWFKAKCGVSIAGTPRDQAFCNYTILHDTVFVVPDAQANPTFAANPLVTGKPHIRFYAGAPLTIAPGIRLGSLCIIDTKPRAFEPADMQRLAGLAQIVIGELWLRDLFQSTDPQTVFEQEGLPMAPLAFEREPFLSGAQVRAARGLLDWSIAQLSSAAGVSANTIKRLEASSDQLTVRGSTVSAVRNAFEQHRVVFTGYDATSVGVRVI